MSPFRPLRRSELDGLVFAAHCAFAKVLDKTWSLECARNFVMALMDGQTLEVFDLARSLLASPTRRAGVVVGSRREHLHAAALATIVYVDSVCRFDTGLHRAVGLMRCGIPVDVLHAVELLRRGERGEVAA